MGSQLCRRDQGRYGLTIVLGTLMGAKRARLRELRTDQYKSYGALSGHSEAELRTLISQMTEMGYLYQTQEKYSVLKLGNITPLKDENIRVIMRTYEEKEPDKKKKYRKQYENEAQMHLLLLATICLKYCENCD